ncbi:MAG: DNA recombination protein RmuC [Lachnospiraceae bacterium]|nr:DNA recombination protein RmuC [Lachnospiraceae bacterium]
MEPELILDIVAVVLLIIIAVLLLAGRKRSELDEIADLLEYTAREQQDSVRRQIAAGAAEQFQRFDLIQERVNRTLQENRAETNEQLGRFSTQLDGRLSATQERQDSRLSAIQEQTQKTLQASREETNRQLREFQEQLDNRLSAIQEQTQKTLQTSREETNRQLREFQEQLDSRLSAIQEQMDNRLTSIQRGNTENMEKVNATLESRMSQLQESNEKRLEQMQGVVDEKLQKTLEARLAQSFELVSRQLDSVQQGLGEMKNLAADTKSLKNALINVKERGTYGEVRLEKLLSDILAPGQYDVNVEIADGKRVEFVIKLPGNGDTPLLLPIDSKFPIEDYNRLLDAEDKQAIDEARKSLTAKIRVFAKDIHDKYIVPPKTTDFALMFLPTEGLYAEVVQNAALFEELRDKYKVTAVGATTLSAFLGSLQIGFKTLAIEKRSQEVWDTLRAVKKQFGEFESCLSLAHKQLQTVDNTIEKLVGTRTRAIQRALRNVEELGEADGGAQKLLEAEVDE